MNLREHLAQLWRDAKAPLLLTGVAVVFGFLPVRELGLPLDREAFLAGQWLRGLTGHFTHASTEHLAWDAAAFLVLGWAVYRGGRRLFWTSLGVAAAAISIAFIAFTPELPEYRGLSGLCSTLFGVFVVREWRMRGVPLVAALFVAKITFECVTGGAVFVSGAGGMVPVPLAHVVGFAGGVAVAGYAAFDQQKRRGDGSPRRSSFSNVATGLFTR